MEPANVPDVDSLIALSLSISEQVNKYAALVRRQPGSPGPDPSLQTLQDQVNVVMKESTKLQALISDPDQWVTLAAWSYLDSVALGLSLDMDIPNHVEPGDKGATLDDLVRSTGASAVVIKRTMRQCINRSIFQELEPGHYRHNRHSLRLRDRNFNSLTHYLVDDGMLSGAYIPRTLAKNHFQLIDNPREAPFCKAFDSDLPLYEYYHTVDIERGQRFARAMAGYYEANLENPIEVMFPFQDMPDGSLLVDIGGGNGQQAIRLASLYPQMSCVVQDHVSVVSAAEKETSLPEGTVGRIIWEAHDFYTPQPRKGAAIYLFHHVLADNTNANCCRMIQAVVDAMDPKTSRILIHDFMDSSTIGEERPRMLDMMGLHMIASLSVTSRSEEEWDAIIRSVDKRLTRHKTWARDDLSGVLEYRLEEDSKE